VSRSEVASALVFCGTVLLVYGLIGLGLWHLGGARAAPLPVAATPPCTACIYALDGGYAHWRFGGGPIEVRCCERGSQP
jgi:hypothetical protein